MTFRTGILKELIVDTAQPSRYKDRYFEGGEEEYFRLISNTCTLYIGNLSFYTGEEQIYEFFNRVAPVKKAIMGLDRVAKTPCGFCFIEYYHNKDAVAAKKFLDGMRLDDRFIRIDYDYGFKEGRQFGRGKRGGQVRDEFRKEYDEARGGWGGVVQEEGGQHREKRHRSEEGHTSTSNVFLTPCFVATP